MPNTTQQQQQTSQINIIKPGGVGSGVRQEQQAVIGGLKQSPLYKFSSNKEQWFISCWAFEQRVKHWLH